ncbi:MAG TPA: hypothetical protein VLM05_16425 [Mycobacteriales bacterium]|nr:hypothetical protein [Mycobacteriales bacterium]
MTAGPAPARFVATGGEVLAVTQAAPGARRLVEKAVGVPLAPAPPSAPTVALHIEPSRAPFDRAGLAPLTRGAYAGGGRVLLEDACSSGFDLLVTADAPAGRLTVRARYRPTPRTRAANLALPQRFRLLAGQTLVHYPVLWRSGWRGRVPLHACVLSGAGSVPMLAGPGGVGKSTFLRRAVAAGAVATADNLCAADEQRCFGLAEPLRVDGPGPRRGRRPGSSHGRHPEAFGTRAGVLAPDRVVVLERGRTTGIDVTEPERAARALVCGTYAAGELRRYWAFAATLALGTGLGPAHPPVAAVAAGYVHRLPCVRVRVGDGDSISLAQLSVVPVGAVAVDGSPR